MFKISDKSNRYNHFLISGLLFILFIAISYLLRDVRLMGCDIAEYLNNPLRVLNGELPYRDFWLLFTPGEVYFPALIYKIFGINTDILRLFTIISSCLIPVAGFYLGKQIFTDNSKSIIVSFIFYFISVVVNYEGPDYIHLYLLFITFSVILLIKYIQLEGKKNNPNLIFVAGISIGLSFLFKLYEVGGAFTGLLLALIYIEFSTHRKFGKIALSLLYFLSGAFIIFLSILISFYDIFGRMFSELVVESLKNGTSMNLPYFNDLYYVSESIKNDFILLAKSPVESVSLIYHLMKFVSTLVFYLLPVLSIIPLLYYRKLSSEQKKISVIFLLWAILSFPKALGRADLGHLAPSAVPFLLFIFYTGYHLGKKYKFQRIFYIVVVSCMMLTVTFPVFKLVNNLKHRPQYVNTGRGHVPFRSVQDAKDFSGTMDYIARNTNSDSYIFVTPWDAPPIYALADRKNPTYYDSLNDLMVRRDENKQRKIIADIVSHRTALIIHNADWGYDNKPEQQFRAACDLLQSFIEKDCDLVAEYGFYKIYKLKQNYYLNNL